MKKNKTYCFRTRNYYGIENAIEKIKAFIIILKIGLPLTETLPEIEEVGKEKKSYKIAFITTVAASLELAKEGKNTPLNKMKNVEKFF